MQTRRGCLLGAVRLYTTSVVAPALRGVTTEMANNTELRETIRKRFLDGRRAALREVLERGVGHGELVGAIDYELALDLLGGPLFYRFLMIQRLVAERPTVYLASHDPQSPARLAARQTASAAAHTIAR